MPRQIREEQKYILVINCGSSSLKYEVYGMPSRESIGKGIVERIGEKNSILKQSGWNGSLEMQESINDHTQAFTCMIRALTHEKHPILDDTGEIWGVGHRVVHGGEEYAESVCIDDDVIRAVQKNIELAPLHNPANLAGITEAAKTFSHCRHVAVFDTAFHQTLLPAAYLYGLPRLL